MDIQVGDRVTYKNEKVEIVNNTDILLDIEEYIIKNGDDKILKVERPSYGVVAEHKELLTDEEREFLKGFINIYEDKILYIRRDIGGFLNIGGKDYVNNIATDKFKGLEEYVDYTLEELGLEEEE